MNTFYVFIHSVDEPPCEVVASRVDFHENRMAIFYDDKDKVIDVFTNFVRIVKSKF